jgi:hypothetical protein
MTRAMRPEPCVYGGQLGIIWFPRGGVAQWLERRPVTPEVAGSSPVILAILCRGSSVGRAKH